MRNLIIIGLLLMSLTIQSHTEPAKIIQLKKKAVYYEIKAQLESNQITLKQAQLLWKKKVKKIIKEHAK